MTDQLALNADGTVTVTIDTSDYMLRVPTVKDWKRYTQQMQDAVTAAKTSLEELNRAVSHAAEKISSADVDSDEWVTAYEAATDKAKAAYHAAVDALADYAAEPFYEVSAGILADMFANLGDALPEDLDEWPVWLATDTSIPGEILGHWRTTPKVSGRPTPP